jgi:hypothetical protein
MANRMFTSVAQDSLPRHHAASECWEIIADRLHAEARSYGISGNPGDGYLSNATVDGMLFAQVVSKIKNEHLRLRSLVPKEERLQGGLRIYGSASGRYRIPSILNVG